MTGVLQKQCEPKVPLYLFPHNYLILTFVSDICQLRIDFDKFVLGIGTTGTCSDSFTVTTPANTNATPNLCGKLTNQHRKSFLKSIYDLCTSAHGITKFL